ncbi:MAG: UDP-galactose-4-epimerase [Methanoregula sp. PtaU1.Bin051]|nr:MAG: UDP-galactose-4-epimerase [Methanoregula sp. PtaU1.Bin051]
MIRKQRICITGGNGFIGSHLARTLCEAGYEVGIISRQDPRRIPEPASSENPRIFRGDIRDYASLSGIMNKFMPDCVLHLATYYAVEHKADEIGVMVDTNVKGTINLLEVAKNLQIGRFVNTSSCAVYHPADIPLSEGDAIRPQNLYALTKVHAEDACSFYSENYGIDSVTFRLFPPYGPGDHERRLIPYVIQSLSRGISPALTTGNQRWDFVYVDDIVNAYLAVLDSPSVFDGHKVFNIGTGQPYSIREVVERLRSLVSPDTELSFGTVPHRKNEVWFNSGNIALAKTELKWEPLIGLDEGLSRTVEWFTRKTGDGIN